MYSILRVALAVAFLGSSPGEAKSEQGKANLNGERYCLEEGYPIALRMLRSDDVKGQEIALKGFASFGRKLRGDPVVEEIQECFLKGKTLDVKGGAMQALAEIGDKRSVAILRAAIADGNEYVRLFAAYGLLHVDGGSREDLELATNLFLASLGQDRDPAVIYTAVETLDRLARNAGFSQPTPPTAADSDVRSFIDDVAEWWKSQKSEVIQTIMEKRDGVVEVQDLRNDDDAQEGSQETGEMN